MPRRRKEFTKQPIKGGPPPQLALAAPFHITGSRDRKPVERFIASPGSKPINEKKKFDPKFQSLLDRARISP